MICAACPRACHTEREYDKPSHGFCKMPYNAVIARAALHMWEEPVISGENGWLNSDKELNHLSTVS